jgi:Family of unknown function (DUF6166)
LSAITTLKTELRWLLLTPWVKAKARAVFGGLGQHPSFSQGKEHDEVDCDSDSHVDCSTRKGEKMKTYYGTYREMRMVGTEILDDSYQVVVERKGLKPYALPLHLNVINHSPTGFCWGYNGSGPAQLALALLIDCLGDIEQTKKYYQQFKNDHIATLNMHGNWGMTEHYIESVITNYKIEEMKK